MSRGCYGGFLYLGLFVFRYVQALGDAYVFFFSSIKRIFDREPLIGEFLDCAERYSLLSMNC